MVGASLKEWNKKMKNAIQTDLLLSMVPEKLDEAETMAQISLNAFVQAH